LRLAVLLTIAFGGAIWILGRRFWWAEAPRLNSRDNRRKPVSNAAAILGLGDRSECAKNPQDLK
jgi:hypothetical protein